MDCSARDSVLNFALHHYQTILWSNLIRNTCKIGEIWIGSRLSLIWAIYIHDISDARFFTVP